MTPNFASPQTKQAQDRVREKIKKFLEDRGHVVKYESFSHKRDSKTSTVNTVFYRMGKDGKWRVWFYCDVRVRGTQTRKDVKHNTYRDIHVPKSNCWRPAMEKVREGARVYIFWEFRDGIWYIPVTEEADKKYKAYADYQRKNLGGRTDRGYEKQGDIQPMTWIPNGELKPLEKLGEAPAAPAVVQPTLF